MSSQEYQSTSSKSFLYYLFFVLIALIMIDKTLQRKQIKPNTNKFTSQVSQISKLDIEDINPSTTNDASESGETSVPEVKAENNLKDLTESFFDETETLQGVYFLKFYQAGNRNYSKLVKVQRKVKGSLKKRIKMALKELKKGPNLDEQDKGVLSVLPQNFHYSKKMKLTEGILHISIDKSFQENAGKDLMQDRLDQLSHTLFEFKEIKGIKVYIDGKEMHSMGKDNLKVPSILARSNFRKVIYL
ncbi:MAG TPA: GerMN domain-containing protein [Leptospiraceae bacterium]|nr:GerMN domain-containing protein [Leptospiraceae bacterium]HMW07530.1 GerMN domain-containing protein [Leptospiraceae bacterium]HMX33292.1 GerMN domain-containing protein [Leptospiraceae bacterium]HMY33169.1 GerMN domain-containing protein [Leptospiraceae bacterium]HMZ66790.1 GerMN domain-containing protein [Leptospiraceae bacterium]